MIKVSSDADRVLVAKLQECGQGSLFDLWSTFSPEDQKAILAQLHALDLPAVTGLITRYREGALKRLVDRVRQPSSFLEIPRTPAEIERRTRAREIGERALRDGKVALLMAAGGLGSRLGLSEPKGNVAVGPVSGKSLYCYHAEKIRAVGRRYRGALPLFVCTSPQTHAQSVAAFREHEYFGLKSQDVKFIEQESLPVIDRRGRFMFSRAGELATRPNGHGAALMGLLSDEHFRSLEARDIEHVFFFQVDNPLVRIADPVFLGLHIDGGHDMSCKTVLKTDPDEKIGIFCQCNGTTAVVEYSELSEADQQLRLPNGRLAFSAGNVAIHVFSLDFLREAREQERDLPYHAVEKRTAYLDRRGRRISPAKPNSIAFETFIFDALAWSKSPLLVETERDEEFSPVKNPRGTDSPETARRAICRLHGRWLSEVGAEVNGNGPSEEDPLALEISPLFALDCEELRAKVELPLAVTGDLYLE